MFRLVVIFTADCIQIQRVDSFRPHICILQVLLRRRFVFRNRKAKTIRCSRPAIIMNESLVPESEDSSIGE